MKQRPIYSVITEAFSYLDRETKIKSAFSALISLVNAILEFVATLMAYPLVLSISNGHSPQLDKFTDQLPYEFKQFIDQDQTIFWAICIVLTLIVKNSFFLFQNWWNFGFTRKSAARLSEELLTEYMRAPYSWHLKKNPAELHRNTNLSVDSIFVNIITPTLNISNEVLLILIMSIFVISVEPTMFIYTILFLAVSGAGYTIFLGNLAARYGDRQQEAVMKLTKSLFHALGGIKEARVLGRQNFLVNDYAILRYKHAHIARVVSMIAVMPRAFLEILLALAMLAGILWITSNNSSDQSMAILGTFGIASIRLMPAIGRILGFFHMVRIGEASLYNIAPHLKLLRSRTTSADRNSEIKHSKRPDFSEDLKLDNVTFSYSEESNTPSLRDINISIRKGQYIGLVGESGAGKSTIVDIILGALSPDNGEVYLDRKKISGNPDVWQGMLGYVPQSIYLLDDTIEKNIAFGLQPDEVDKELLQNALKSAQLEDFVASLELGLNTLVGDRGVRLSGGQIQRIGIARALYCNPDILIMDEGTSALDGATEAKLTAAIDQLRGTKTIILIAHRLSTIRNCDSIAVMDKGRIVDIGSYETLMKRCELFINMVRHANLD